MLILNTCAANNVPIITNAAGDVNSGINFSIDDDAEVYQSCSITWNNQFYVFGGVNKLTQISKVTNCRLEIVGELAFEYPLGACVNVADELIYLCFDHYNGKKCRLGASPIGKFNEITSSHYEHKSNRIATNNGELELFFKSKF